MDRFGWAGHPGPLQAAWDSTVRPDDVVIVAGDISWAMRPDEAREDLAWLDARPGRKVLLRGNHDYWWGDSSAKLRQILAPYPTFAGFLRNCAVEVAGYVIAGSRLWTVPRPPRCPAARWATRSRGRTTSPVKRGAC